MESVLDGGCTLANGGRRSDGPSNWCVSAVITFVQFRRTERGADAKDYGDI